MGGTVMDDRVGHAATSALETLIRETIMTAWAAKDYTTITNYIPKYERVRKYNEEPEKR